MNIVDRPAKQHSLRLLLAIMLAVALLGVVQLETSHFHAFDHAIECDLHATAPPLDATVSQPADWFWLFAIAPLQVLISVSQSAPTFPRYLSRAPPVVLH